MNLHQKRTLPTWSINWSQVEAKNEVIVVEVELAAVVLLMTILMTSLAIEREEEEGADEVVMTQYSTIHTDPLLTIEEE